MVLNLFLIQKVIHPNSGAGLVTLQLWTHLIAPGLTSSGDLSLWCHPSAGTTKETPHLSNPPATAAQPYQPWALGSSSKTHPPHQAVTALAMISSAGATPQIQQLGGGSFCQTAHYWVLKNWRMGKKELPVLLKDKDGMWMNAQGMQQICFSIQAGIFIQVQHINWKNDWKKEKADMGWQELSSSVELRWSWWAVDKSTMNNKDSQRHKELIFLK